MPSWRTAQSKKQIAKKVKLALIALGLILGLLLSSQAFKFTQMLFGQKEYAWNGDFNINILMRSKTISLLSYNPKDQKITVIDIPGQTYLDVPGDFGKWQLGSIYGLGGDKLLKDSLANFFGIPIDGFLDPVSLGELTDKNPFPLFSILPNIKTDLTLFEIIRLKMGLASVRFDKINQIDLVVMGLLEKSSLADGTEVFVADPVRLDSLTAMVDPEIKSEHKTIAIFNSTQHPGLAQKAARLITNIGGNVIITSNGKNKFKHTRIYGEKSKTLDRLRQIFDVRDTIVQSDEDLVSSRAQISLFLGEDYFDQ